MHRTEHVHVERSIYKYWKACSIFGGGKVARLACQSGCANDKERGVMKHIGYLTSMPVVIALFKISVPGLFIIGSKKELEESECTLFSLQVVLSRRTNRIDIKST